MTRGRVVLLAAALVLALAAVLGRVPRAAAGEAAGETLRIGVLRLASSGPVFIAAERGYFAAEGLDAELVFFDAAQPVAVAVVSGSIDVGVTGLTAGFYNLAGKGALRIIGAQSREEPGHHLVAYLAGNEAFAAGLKSLDDFPGHTVAVTQIGSTFHYSLGLLAEKRGFPLSRLRLVPLQSISNEISALVGNQVDAALLPATDALPLVAKHEAHLLGWVGDETPWQLGAIFAGQPTVAERRAVLVRFLAAYRRGAGDFYAAFLAPEAERDEAAAPALLALLAKYTGQHAARIADGIPYVDPDARLRLDDIRHQVVWYQSQGLVDKSVDADAVVDSSFAAAEPSR